MVVDRKYVRTKTSGKEDYSYGEEEEEEGKLSVINLYSYWRFGNFWNKSYVSLLHNTV